jgi:hypothetical protein
MKLVRGAGGGGDIPALNRNIWPIQDRGQTDKHPHGFH